MPIIKKIGSVFLGSSDITVAQDGTDPKEYTYSLSNSGVEKVNTALNTINQKALTSGGLYYTADTSDTGRLVLHQLHRPKRLWLLNMWMTRAKLLRQIQ